LYKSTINTLGFFIWFCTALSAQQFDVLQVNDQYSDEELIEDVFLKGFCGNVSNIEAIGEELSVGHFFNGDNIIGIDRGIIISCGDIRDASSPNINTETTSIVGTTGDIDLSRIATAAVFDASGISFDFVPLSNRVSFTYVFASEEYCEWVGTQFNDVFGFFVSGPGISGQFSNDGVNVALLPGSNEFVSINTINHQTNPEFYIKNELFADAQRCAIPFEPRFPESIEYDGFTLPLKAAFDVIPCETYTIRLVVSDVNDELYDSAVFLEMNSFDIGGNLRITASSESSSDTIVSEGCTNGIFTFERAPEDIGLNQTFDIGIDPNSTAIEGLDFEAIPRTVNFLSGELTVELPVNIIDDNLLENAETLGLILSNGCECSDQKNANLLINDNLTFNAEFETLQACEEQDFMLTPIVIGGSPPYSYLWNNGSQEATIVTKTNTTTSYDVTIQDFCGRTTSASTRVTIKDLPSASIDADLELCNGLDQFVEVKMEGTPPWSITYQLNQDSPIEILDIDNQPYLIPVTEEGILQLLEFSDRTCIGQVSGTAILSVEDIEIDISEILPECLNTFDGALSLDIVSDSPARSISWSPMVNDDYNPTKLQAGDYLLTIEDERGCILEETIVLQTSRSGDSQCDKLNIFIPNVYSPNNDGQNDDFIIHLEYEPQIVSVQSFSIFDRWGNRVFEKKNFLPSENNLEFDAILLDKKLSPQILSYIINLNMIDNSSRSVAGTITLIR